MPGRRKLLASVLGRTGGFNVLLRGRGLLPAKLTILAYHRIVPATYLAEYQRDHELISATSDAFEKQLHFVAGHYNVIGLADLKASEENGQALPSNPLLITFDDGFRDNYEIAYPLLRRFGTTAVFFVATDYIGTRQGFWFDQVYSNLMAVAGAEIPLGGETLSLSPEPSCRERQVRKILGWLCRCPDQDRLEFLEKLADLPEGPALRELDIPLTWDDLREMAAGGMEIGSHTRSHPILSTLDDAKLEKELRGSKQIIEQELGTEVLSLAYPVGISQAYSQRVKDMAKHCGYRYGLSYVQANNPVPVTDRFDLKRVHVEAYHDLDAFRFDLCFPPRWG